MFCSSEVTEGENILLLVKRFWSILGITISSRHAFGCKLIPFKVEIRERKASVSFGNFGTPIKNPAVRLKKSQKPSVIHPQELFFYVSVTFLSTDTSLLVMTYKRTPSYEGSITATTTTTLTTKQNIIDIKKTIFINFTTLCIWYASNLNPFK